MFTIDPDGVGSHFESRPAEERWDKIWAETGLYRFQESEGAPAFVIDTPPPTVSGSLHVGHVFSYTQTDVLARYMRMRGRSVFYPMGWDDNGLPTERRVQNYFHVRCEPGAPHLPGLQLEMADEAARKHAPRKISRANFIELCLALTQEDERAFKDLWRRLGLSVDWALEYSTISRHSRRMAQLSFLDLLEKGHVYNVEAPTLWDVDFKTAVAQAEVEDRPTRAAFHRLRFGVEGGGQFEIATTRPELLPACVAVATHPQDARHAGLIGRRAITPLFRAAVPIFASPLVDPEKGTGILMVCTFGDATDVQWWREEQLPLRQVIDRDGRFAGVTFGEGAFESTAPAQANEFYAALRGKTIKEAQKTIVELLRQGRAAALGAEPPLVGEPQAIEHVVKFYEKGDRPLEYITTRQWFVRLLDKKQPLIAAGEAIRWHPDFMRQRYRNWTENLQMDWCISRQRYFGVPFPVRYPVTEEGASDFERPIVPEAARLPVDPSLDVPAGYEAAQRDEPGGFRAESDVFDTWFTSSLSPQIATGWSDAPVRHARLFPMDLRPQSHEIIRTWAFYTIVKAHLHQATIPWRHVAISGWVLDPDRKKMSKSKGNVTTPTHLLDQYGADPVRYWALSARLGADTAFDEKVLKIGRRLVVKLFNAAKFVLSQSAAPGRPTRELDRAFLAALRDVVLRVTRDLDELDYASALGTAERFFWSRFTDAYVEIVKARARSERDPEGRTSAVAALQLALSVQVRLFAPYLPYVTEEVWAWGFGKETGQPSVHRAGWPALLEFEAAADDPGVFEVAVAFVEAVHKAKSAAGASVGRHLQRLRLASAPDTAATLARSSADLSSAARVDELSLEVRHGMEPVSFEVLELVLADRPDPEAVRS